MVRWFVLVGLLASVGAAQETPQAFVGGRLIPIDGDPIENGAIVIHNGKIVAVGPADAVSIPANSDRHDTSGKVILPGLVDTHTHAGSVEGADRSAPIQPDVRALDSINARDSGIQKAQAGGITTANIMPGSGHLLSGQTLYVKYRDTKTIDGLLIHNTDGSIAYGIKMANGTNSRRAPPFPGTRAKSAALVREQFVKAREYQQKIANASDDPEKKPERDLGMEALVDVLEGKRVVHHHTHRHDDIATVLRLAAEFNFKVVLQHVSDAWLMADEIAASDNVVGSSIILIDSPGSKIEAKDNRFESAAALERAGALVGFHTDDGVSDSRLLVRMAALAVRSGMSREKALYGLTMAGAIMLELEDRIGSLTVGKDADLAIFSSDPLSVYSQVLETWVDGEKVFDRANEKDRLYAEGGYGASHDQSIHADEIARDEH